jgi:DNA primase
LLSRGFDLGELIKVWNVQGTSWWGPFTWRILIPIYFGGRLISYTLRAIDKEDNPKYWTHRKGSTSTREVLFGWDLLKAKKAVVVEGPFDAMRLGPGAVATLGLGFSKEQVNLLGMLDSLFIIFDAERGAYQRAKKMGRKLAGIVETEIIQLDKGDPADLEQKQADNIMDELGF